MTGNLSFKRPYWRFGGLDSKKKRRTRPLREMKNVCGSNKLYLLRQKQRPTQQMKANNRVPCCSSFYRKTLWRRIPASVRAERSTRRDKRGKQRERRILSFSFFFFIGKSIDRSVWLRSKQRPPLPNWNSFFFFLFSSLRAVVSPLFGVGGASRKREESYTLAHSQMNALLSKSRFLASRPPPATSCSFQTYSAGTPWRVHARRLSHYLTSGTQDDFTAPFPLTCDDRTKRRSGRLRIRADN